MIDILIEKKEEYIRILTDISNAIDEWEWDEDYHKSGLKDREDRIAWTRTRLSEIIEIIKTI